MAYCCNSFQDSSTYAITKLQELKEAIRDKSNNRECDVVEYQSPKELAEKLLIALKASIERDFPVIRYLFLYPFANFFKLIDLLILFILLNSMSELASLQEEHTNFAHQKSLTYVPTSQCLQLLDEYIKPLEKADHGRYLMVTGPSGSGKSSLIAHWWQASKST
jgi:hypothetical protein